MGEGNANICLPDFSMVAVDCGLQGPKNSQELTFSGYVKSVQLEAYLFQSLCSASPGVKELLMVKREEYH